jgi:hypothetical protein
MKRTILIAIAMLIVYSISFANIKAPVSAIQPIEVSHRMNIEHLAPGIYFIKIGNKVKKFVKI